MPSHDEDDTTNPESPANLECSVEEVAALLAAGTDFSFIDVRRDEEWALAHIEGAELANVEACLALQKERLIVFTCHTGVRSLHAAKHFRDNGFVRACSMAGGIEAWSLRVDSAVPLY
ncbi:MAG: rhodanese-like domain-containing protein [Planctomycetota bacterium]|nr:rhodanese-like domain-containing protein [Planctomycetota bacterium]